MKQIDVTCPCCSTRLTIDVATAKVMRESRGPSEERAADPWASAQEKVRSRTSSGQEKLESALEEERGKAARFDEVFRKANENLKRKDDDG